ncbi:MAG: hypothetical protein KC502_21745, partial [Myxococcales bacterium]|nr:hypothetical protein [Myxococcales bacterium]
MTLPDDLPLNKARGWLLAADHPERRDALVGCTLDDAVSDAEWLIDAVVGTTLHLLDVDDEDGERTATRDLARLSADAVILLPDDLPTAQASLLAEAVARTETPKERASRELIEAMGLDVDQLGGPLWVGRIAAVASATEDAVAIPAQALMAVHNHLLLTRNYRPATQLFEAVAVDDPMPSTR